MRLREKETRTKRAAVSPTFQQQQTPPRYGYQPLRNSQSVRLLRLEGGQGDDPIQCCLSEVCLDDWPSYEAVSYMWGNPDDKSTIICNEKTISIPRNLVDGLRILRLPDRQRVLWADALCINQEDLDERSSQVQLMARVFSEASKVLIWLGHGDFFKIQVALNYICRYTNREMSKSSSPDAIASYLWRGREMDMRESGAVSPDGTPGDFTLVALDYLFTCPYFQRGWIIQEIVLPKRAEILWDQARIDFHWLEEIISDLRSSHRRQLSWDARSGLGAVDQICMLRLSLHDTPEQYSFTQLLTITSYNNFTDPRDYIYGLLGLQKICNDMSSQQLVFQPDYNTTPLECFRAAVEKILIEREDFAILAMVLHGRSIPDSWPSWVPELNLRADIQFSYLSHKWSASGLVKATLSRQTHGECDYMRIRGIRVASLNRKISDVEDLQTLVRRLGNRYGERSTAWTITSGQDYDRRMLVGNQRRESEHMRDYRAFLAHDFGEKVLHNASSDAVQRAERFRIICAEVLGDYRLFETDEGLLGLGPRVLQPGDQVVIFFGGSMPFLLRAVGTRWRLVGVCFAYGIMEGEAIEQMEKDGKYTAEDFDLF